MYIGLEFYEKSTLNKRFWPSKSGFEIYKPRVIMAHVRYTIILSALEAVIKYPQCSGSTVKNGTQWKTIYFTLKIFAV